MIQGCLEMPQKDFWVSVLPYDLLHLNRYRSDKGHCSGKKGVSLLIYADEKTTDKPLSNNNYEMYRKRSSKLGDKF